jgi:hypothetical protein
MAAFGRSLARTVVPRRQLSGVVGRPTFSVAARCQGPKGDRSYSSGPQATSSGASSYLFAAAGLAAAAGGAYYFLAGGEKSNTAKKTLDYQEVYNAVADVLEENADDYDGQGPRIDLARSRSAVLIFRSLSDGSYGPVILRLAWQ